MSEDNERAILQCEQDRLNDKTDIYDEDEYPEDEEDLER